MRDIFDELCEIEGILLNVDIKNNFKDLNYSEEEKKAIEEYSNTQSSGSALGDALGEALKNKE